MTVFALANLFAANAASFWQLLTARILLAVAAGLYVPSASALAGAIVTPERRGTALAIVNGGTSIAVALGVPLGALIGHALGWRITLLELASWHRSSIAGLFFGIPRGTSSCGLSVPSIRERLAVHASDSAADWFRSYDAAGDPEAQTVYTYFASYLTTVTATWRRRLSA